jgi:enediyne biosynthesis protein E4
MRFLVLGLLVCFLGSGCGSKPNVIAPQDSVASPSTSIRMVDIAQQAGLNYQWVISGKRPLNILQTIGNGCALFDYNNDGNLDILLVGPKLALYKGDGHGHFTDVTHEMGLDKFHGHFLGCAVGDYDNDGYEDIYVTAYQGGLLLHNEHGKYFTDATLNSGIKPQPWATSAAWVDLYNDGRLDLYIGNYIVFGPNTNPQLCDIHGVMDGCGPGYYKPHYGVLYHNMGGGKFEDVTAAWGANKVSGKNLGVAFADYDNSGRQSLALANDEVAGNLLKNMGGRFVDIGATCGTAYSADGNEVGGMGIDWGDYNNAGRLDLAEGTYQHEAKCIYHNDGSEVFSEQSGSLGLAAATAPNVAFGLKWVDLDNDGWLDLLISNGHVDDQADRIPGSTTYRQKTQLFYNRQGQSFDDISSALVGDADRPIVGRGLAIGDFDNDGRMDALIVDDEGKPILLHNETPNAGHWMEINLVGTKSNRDGQGALITVEVGGVKRLRQCTTSGSYMSASDKRVHFGLAGATMVHKVTVHWPSGHVDVYTNVRADRIVTLKEGDSALLPYP